MSYYRLAVHSLLKDLCVVLLVLVLVLGTRVKQILDLGVRLELYNKILFAMVASKLD